MSRRDLVHVLSALHELSGGRAGVGVAVADVDRAVGRSDRDMRTPLNLASLAGEGAAAELPDGTWALTHAGIARIAEDRELSG